MESNNVGGINQALRNTKNRRQALIENEMQIPTSGKILSKCLKMFAGPGITKV